MRNYEIHVSRRTFLQDIWEFGFVVENHAKPPGRIIKNSQGSLPPSESSWSVCQQCRKCSRHIGFPSDVCLRLEAFDDFHLLIIIKPYTNWVLAHGFDNNNWYNNRIFQHFNIQPNPWVCSTVDSFNPTPGFSNRPQGQEALQSSVVCGFCCTTLSWIFWSPCFGV